MFPAAALFAVVCAAPVPPSKPATDPPLLLSVGIHAVHGRRVLTPGGGFPVVLTNTSDKPVKVWREWCSWGYFNLSLVFRDDGPGGAGERVAVKVSRGWTKNYPDAAELAPGESVVFDVKLTDGQWENLGLAAKADGAAAVTMRVRYTNKPDDDTRKQDVWTGTLETPFRAYTVAK